MENYYYANEAIVNTEINTVGIYYTANDSGNVTIESLVPTCTDLYDFNTCSNTGTNMGTDIQDHAQEQI